MNKKALLRDDEKIDSILGGRLGIIQPKRGYRFSIDALLLAGFVHLQEQDRVIDLGTGCGIIAIILAKQRPEVRVLGVEIQDRLVSIAKRSIQLNGLSDEIEIVKGDIRFPESFCTPESFSTAVFNPPYRGLHSGRINPDPEKAVARHEILGTLGDFMAAAAYALRPGGHVYVIYPSMRMSHLLAQMRLVRIEPKRLCTVYSHSGASACFVLVDGLKGGGEELDVLPPICIYNRNGKYTRQMTRILRCLAPFAPCAAV